MADYTPEQQKAIDALNEAADAAERAGIQIDKFGKTSLKNISERFAFLDKQVKKQGGSYKGLEQDLADLRETIEKDTETYKTAKEKRRALDDLETRARIAFTQTLQDTTYRIAGILITGYARYFVNQAKVAATGLMGTGSPFQLAAQLQTQAYTDMNKTVQDTTGTVAGAAPVLAGLAVAAGVASGGAALLAAGLVTAGAKLVGFMSDVATELEIFKTKTLGDALDVTAKSFNQAANAGALFAGGLDEFRKITNEAAVTQDVFSAVLARNSQNLAESGLGVTEATRLLSKTMGLMAKQFDKSVPSVRDQLQNLGIAIEDQGDVVADVIGMMKRTGQALTPEALQRETLAYAKNLRVITELTGEDARKRVQESRRLTEQFGFQTRFLQATGGNAKLLEQYTRESAKYPPVLQKAIQQATRLGTVTEFDAIQAGYKEVAEAIGSQIRSGNVNIRLFDQMVSDNLQTFTGSTKDMELAMDAANSGLGVYGEVLEALTEKQKYAYAFANNNLNLLSNNVEGAATTGSDFNKSINTATSQLMEMRKTLQNDVTPALKNFAAEIPKILQDAEDKLRKAGILTGILPKEAQPRPPATENTVLTPQRPTESRQEFEKRAEDLRESQNTLSKIGKAKGGISEGPTSGYTETLHGTEAVVPLPDNRTIPVSLDSSSITAAINQQTTVLTEILRAMQNNNDLTSRIVQSTY